MNPLILRELGERTWDALEVLPLPVWMTASWVALVWVLAALAVFFLIYYGLSLATPKLAAIARTAAIESWSQPLFWAELLPAIFLLVLFAIIPYYTFGEDIKILTDSSLTLITLLAIILAVWCASVSIAEEIEGRTALTLLSKPVSRRSFVLGKFVGIAGAVFVLFIVLGGVFLSTVSFKVVYDAHESARDLSDVQRYTECLGEQIRVIPGLVLSFFKAVLLTAVSVAISTRLPLIPNLTICSAVYVLGHLVQPLAQSSAGKFEIVRFVGQLFATILPVLDYMDVQASISSDGFVPLSYVGWSFLYCAMYSTVALLAALVFFEDRDLA